MVIDKDFIAKIQVYPHRFSTEPFYQRLPPGRPGEEGICESNFFIYTSYKINYTTDCLMYSNHSRSETIFPERGILTRAVLVLVANFFQESIA